MVCFQNSEQIAQTSGGSCEKYEGFKLNLERLVRFALGKDDGKTIPGWGEKTEEILKGLMLEPRASRQQQIIEEDISS